MEAKITKNNKARDKFSISIIVPTHKRERSVKMISVIVVLYNSEFFIEKFLTSLLAESNLNLEVILIDNKSPDRTLEKINKMKSFFKKNKQIKIIVNKRNLGFSKAVNKGITSTLYDDVLLINPDTLIHKNAIKKLSAFYNKKKPCIVGGSYIDYIDQSITQNSAVNSTSFVNCILELTNLKKFIPFQSVINKFWIKNTEIQAEVCSVSGGFMMLSKKIFNQLNKFDEKFWMYLEDLDFCIRAKFRGFKVYYYPAAKIMHFSGGSSRFIRTRNNEVVWWTSRDYFFRKHFKFLQYLIFKIIERFEIVFLKLIKNENFGR